MRLREGLPALRILSFKDDNSRLHLVLIMALINDLKREFKEKVSRKGR